MPCRSGPPRCAGLHSQPGSAAARQHLRDGRGQAFHPTSLSPQRDAVPPLRPASWPAHHETMAGLLVLGLGCRSCRSFFSFCKRFWTTCRWVLTAPPWKALSGGQGNPRAVYEPARASEPTSCRCGGSWASIQEQLNVGKVDHGFRRVPSRFLHCEGSLPQYRGCVIQPEEMRNGLGGGRSRW